MERILRALLAEKGIRVGKGPNWHKDLLLAARNHALVSEHEFDAFSKLLLFRHVQVHGYGFMLEDPRPVEIACDTAGLCHGFWAHL